ncbi:hypothetical protein K6119_08995 [Paracrocinitomix mangrovi]|uniref:hypothetical protein n=1 Tax=Paracrocinitomix mangrovi TaxID=2862509 RepID=UPI001C8EEB8F|nr:hypothetical protein [Paracrocinitomix mangrovi]UKN03648.1 hypothetical protein K6119_08995 [Paracrocinitomix mangrovi]
MFKAVLLILLLTSSFLSFSQSQEQAEEEVFQLKKSLVLTVDFEGVDKDTQGAIKDEFIGYKDKMYSVELNEKTEVLKVVHVLEMQKNEAMAILLKFGIDESRVVSYE